jgi:integrase
MSTTIGRRSKALKLPMVSFHALRHTHASALIAAGLDVVLISRRLGHGNPHVTLGVYGHLFKRDDTAAARAERATNRAPHDRRIPVPIPQLSGIWRKLSN